jgi:hypothetical protein
MTTPGGLGLPPSKISGSGANRDASVGDGTPSQHLSPSELDWVADTPRLGSVAPIVPVVTGKNARIGQAWRKVLLVITASRLKH